MKKNEKIINFRPSREQAMEAVKTLLAYTGDDPSREGLVDTPKTVSYTHLTLPTNACV